MTMVRVAIIVIAVMVAAFVAMEYALIDHRTVRCKIVGDREYVTGNCIPYCPPHPSECR
jgi:hypothetical protein